MKNYKILIWAAVIVAGVVGLYLLTHREAGGNFFATKTPRVGKLQLVEYGDFQCPACYQYYPLVKETVAAYKDKIDFTYKHFPIDFRHPNARIAGAAAEAARNQGKFYEMYAALYENRDWVEQADAHAALIALAASLKLNIPQFKRDLDAQATKDRVQTDYAEGVKLGVKATPSFFIDGVKVTKYPQTVEQFKKLIEKNL